MGIEDFGAPVLPPTPEPEQDKKPEDTIEALNTPEGNLELTTEEIYIVTGRKDSILTKRGINISIDRTRILLEMGIQVDDKTNHESVADALYAKHLELLKIEDYEASLPEFEELAPDSEMGPVVDLLQELVDANAKALAEDPDYKSAKDGGKMMVWKHLTDDAKIMWNYQVWNPNLLTSPDGLQGFMDREPHRKIDRVPDIRKKIKINKPK